MNSHNLRAFGFSLIELIVSIVILSIGVTAFISLIINTTKNSVDPQIRQQSNAIAQAYLEEIILNQFCEPDFDPDGDGLTECSSTTVGEGCTESACAAASTNTCAGANAVGGVEASRAVFDDVCDYDGLTDVGAKDQNGNAITNLEDYTVSVTVNDGSDIDLNGLSGNNGQVVRIDVSVNHSTGVNATLSAFKTNY